MSSSVVSPASSSQNTIAAKPRLPFIIALRAVASVIIQWHHFALYPPLRGWAAPLAGYVLALSLMLAALFHRWVEQPVAVFGRRDPYLKAR